MLSRKSTKKISFLLAASLLTAAVSATTQAGRGKWTLFGLFSSASSKPKTQNLKNRGTMTQQPNYKTAGTTTNKKNPRKIKQENRFTNAEIVSGNWKKFYTGSRDVLLEEWFTIRTKNNHPGFSNP